MHNQFKTQTFKHLMLAMGPRDLNSAPYSPVHCSSHSMTSFQPSELTELPVVENSQLFAQRVHSACIARAQRTVRPLRGGRRAFWGGGGLSCQENDPADAHPSAHRSVLESANRAWTRSVHLDAPGQRHGQQPVSVTADPRSSQTGQVIEGLR